MTEDCGYRMQVTWTNFQVERERAIAFERGMTVGAAIIAWAEAIRLRVHRYEKCDHCGDRIVRSYATTTVGWAIYCSGQCADAGDPRKR